MFRPRSTPLQLHGSASTGRRAPCHLTPKLPRCKCALVVQANQVGTHLNHAVMIGEWRIQCCVVLLRNVYSSNWCAMDCRVRYLHIVGP